MRPSAFPPLFGDFKGTTIISIICNSKPLNLQSKSYFLLTTPVNNSSRTINQGFSNEFASVKNSSLERGNTLGGGNTHDTKPALETAGQRF
jgi:hypothetical protein